MINLIARINGGGLTRDAKILTENLGQLGTTVTNASDFRVKDWLHKMLSCQLNGNGACMNLFLEHVFQPWLFTSRRNTLLPNQEWTNSRDLRDIDLVLCKTKYALEIFRALGLRSEYVSFTSEDHSNGTLVSGQIVKSALHIAGGSSQKGTKLLIKLWLKHPEWPTLIVVHRMLYPGWQEPLLQPQAPNIRYISEYISDDDIRELQNTSPIHIYPSEAEGWGHSTVEGLSCGAVVITTDGAPMNEVVTSERGILVHAARIEKKNLGYTHFASLQALEQACKRAFEMTCSERQSMGGRARNWYLQNNAVHKEILRDAISRITL